MEGNNFNHNSDQNSNQNEMLQNNNQSVARKIGKDVINEKAKKTISKNVASGAAKKSMIAAFGPIIAYASVAIFAIIVIVGIATFLMTMPGMALDQLRQFAKSIGNNIASYFGSDSTKRVDEDRINILLDHLENMGYDLKGYGFLTEYMTESDVKGDAYLDDEQGVVRYSKETEVDLDGKTQKRPADSIKKAKSEFLFTYIVSDNYVYTIKNFNLSTSDGNHWYDKVFGFFKGIFARIADATIPGHLGYFSESWGKGLIAIYYESGGKIGKQGSFYQDSWFGLADNISFDYEKKELKIKRGFGGKDFKYKLEGWTGRYGVPLEFLLSVHIGTMMPDLAYDLATSFPTEVKILLHEKNAEEKQYIPYISKVENHWYRDVYFVEDSSKEFVQTDTEYENLMKERWTLYEVYDEGELKNEFKLYAINSKGEYAQSPSEIRNYDKASSRLVSENGMYLFRGTQEEAQKLDIAVTKKAKTLSYSDDSDFESIGWQQEDGIWTAYRETKSETLRQTGEGLRTETNPAIKMMFLYNTYFRYDGTAETAEAITQLRKENDIKLGALDLKYDLSNGYDELEKHKTEVNVGNDKKTFSIKDVSGKVSLNQDSLNAFSMMENMDTLDADYIYRDFKELVVELGYFTKEEMTDELPKVLAWMVPDTGCKGYPYRLLDKRENEFGTMIHSKGDIDACKDNKLALIKEMGEDDSTGGDTDSEGGSETEGTGGTEDGQQETGDQTEDPTDEGEATPPEDLDDIDITDIPDDPEGEDEDRYAKVRGQTNLHMAGQSFRGSNIIETARNCWKYITDNGSKYSYASGNIPIEEGNTVDCSSYICWVLYEYGYEDFKGKRVNSEGLVNTNWNELYGWEEFPIASGQNPIDFIQPGDIIVRFEGYDKGQTHHTNFVVEVENGHYKAFDCGCESNWRCSAAQGGNPIDKSYFLTASGAGKVIRVENPGQDKDAYVGYLGNEAVVSPVTGILLEYGTYSNAESEKDERTNVDLKYGGTVLDNNLDASSDQERQGEIVVDKVGYAKIMLLDAEHYKKLEKYTDSYWASDSKTLVNPDPNTNASNKLIDDEELKSVKNLRDRNKWNNKNKTVYGYKEFAETYEKTGMAGKIIYLDGFVCQDVDKNFKEKDLKKSIPKGKALTINDFKITDFDDRENQRPSEFFIDKNYKSINVEVTDRIKVENKIKSDAVSSYCLKEGDEELIFIKEGTVLGRTMTDKELLEAPYLRNCEHGTFDELRPTEESNPDEEEKKNVIGNYIRLILRDEEDTVVENVEDYIDLEPDKRKDIGDLEKLMTWQALEVEGFYWYAIPGFKGGKDHIYEFGHLSCRPDPADMYGFDWVIGNGGNNDMSLSPGIFLGWRAGQTSRRNGQVVYHASDSIHYGGHLVMKALGIKKFSDIKMWETWVPGEKLIWIYEKELLYQVKKLKKYMDPDRIDDLNQDQRNALIDVMYRGEGYLSGHAYGGTRGNGQRLIKAINEGKEPTAEMFAETNPEHMRRRYANYWMFKKGDYMVHVNNGTRNTQFDPKSSEEYEFLSDTPFQDLMYDIQPTIEIPWDGPK